MAETKIEWTDMTWNPVRGCTRVSEGCRNCYAEVMAARFSDPGMWGHGFAARTPGGGRWTGKVEPIPEKLTEPLRWKKPRRIFVNSTSDLSHESLLFESIAAVFGVMAMCEQHTFQVLTKRPERAVEWFQWISEEGKKIDPHAWSYGGYADGTNACLSHVPPEIGVGSDDFAPEWPLPNVQIGTSIEDQPTADERIPELLKIPAAVRFLSCEPLLGPVDIASGAGVTYWDDPSAGISWVIVGGESGPHAWPMHPNWARSIRDQCQAAGVAFFFKQWGEWAPVTGVSRHEQYVIEERLQRSDVGLHWWPDNAVSYRVGKKAAGRLLDGREWNEFPEVQA